MLKKNVTYETIKEDSEGQKIDNFLLKILKNIPKSHIYKILRSGEIRVNKKRVKTGYKLTLGDTVRIPPLSYPAISKPAKVVASHAQKILLEQNIVFEDDCLIALNKPAGIAVHGGSGISLGVIEQFRQLRPDAKFLELVHRIDKDTSGLLLLAKKRSALVAMHELIRKKRLHKKYLVMVAGSWQKKQLTVDLDLVEQKNHDGLKKVSVAKTIDVHVKTKQSKSIFFLKRRYTDFSMLEVKLITGRTHQIRVHLAHLGFPILGDEKYGNFELNKTLRSKGVKRMFLHAMELGFTHPILEKNILLNAPVPDSFTALEESAT